MYRGAYILMGTCRYMTWGTSGYIGTKGHKGFDLEVQVGMKGHVGVYQGAGWRPRGLFKRLRPEYLIHASFQNLSLLSSRTSARNELSELLPEMSFQSFSLR